MLPLDFGSQANDKKAKRTRALTRARGSLQGVSTEAPDPSLTKRQQELNRDEWADDLVHAGWDCVYRRGIRIWCRDRNDPNHGELSEEIAYLKLKGS